jgi:DNA polymerase III epsilon subunit-like protein
MLNLTLPHKIVVFDTETGGLNPTDEITWNLNKNLNKAGSKINGQVVRPASPIIEIGAVILSPRDLKEVDQFHAICGPEKSESFESFTGRCTTKALEINGFDKRLDELKKAKPLSEVLQDFIAWLPREGNRVRFIPCGQNVRFDIDMINMACKRYGIDYQIQSHPLELTAYSQLYFALSDTQVVANYKLTTVSEALGISIKGAHEALTDVKMTAECIRRMFERFAN